MARATVPLNFNSFLEKAKLKDDGRNYTDRVRNLKDDSSNDTDWVRDLKYDSSRCRRYERLPNSI